MNAPQRKCIFFIYSAVLAVNLLLMGCREVGAETTDTAIESIPSPTEDQRLNIDDMLKKEKSSLKSCAVSVNFQINNIRYQIDPKRRTSFSWRDLGGHEYRNINSRHVQKGCPNVDLGQISYFSAAGETGISVFKDISVHKKFQTNFQRFENTIAKADQENAFRIA